MNLWVLHPIFILWIQSLYFETHIYARICQPYPLLNSFKPPFPTLVLLTITSGYVLFLTSYYSLLVLLSLWPFHQQSSRKFLCFLSSIVFSPKVHFSSTSPLHQVFPCPSPSPIVRQMVQWRSVPLALTLKNSISSSSEHFREPEGQSTRITYPKFSAIKLSDWQNFKCPIIL